MESEISLDVIQSTQEALGKFVKRPALSEKLLRKPPFRFLHDIVTCVIKTNGFLQGLYTDDELVSENVNNRDGKIAFLTKLIAVVSLVVQKPLSARPSKIIAGQEPEKTNELLQNIGIALENNLSSDSAVKIYTDKTKKKEKDVSKSKENRNIKFDGGKKKDDTKNGTIVASKPPKKNPRDNSTSRLSEKSNPEKVSSRDKLQTDRSVRRIDPNKDKDKKKRIATKDEPTTRTKLSEKDVKLPPKPAKSSKSLASIKSSDSRESKSKKAMNNNKKHQEDDIQKETELVSPQLESIIPNGNFPHEIEDPEKATVDQINLQKNNEEEEISDNLVDNNLKYHNSLDSIDHSSIQNDVNRVSGSGNLEEALKNPKLNHSAPSEPKIENGVSEVQPNIIHMPEIEVKHKSGNREELNTPKPISEEMKVVGKVMTQKSEDLPDHKRIGMQRSGTIENLNQVVQNIEENKDMSRSKTLLRPPSARPPSARPGAPRLKDKNDVSSNPAEPIVSGKVNVIVEKYGLDKEDEDGSLVVVESNIETVDSIKPTEEVSQLIGAGHGHLVQQILDTQSDFKRSQGGNVEIEWEFGARKAKEAYTQEIENLRIGLQAVSHAANPLGKLFDHIQEDVEVMQQELDNWKEVYKQASIDLALQRSLTEQSTLPLESKLRQLDAEILDKRDQINTLKAQIYKNTAEIDKLLDCNNVQ